MQSHQSCRPLRRCNSNIVQHNRWKQCSERWYTLVMRRPHPSIYASRSSQTNLGSPPSSICSPTRMQLPSNSHHTFHEMPPSTFVHIFTLGTVLSFFNATASRCTSNPSSHNFRLGNMTGTVIYDGPIILEPDSSLFSVPNDAVRRSFRASFRPTNPYSISSNIAIIDTPSARIMLDTGSFNTPSFPIFREAGKLIRNMRAAGINPESIDAVFLTHAHADHCAGLVDSDGMRRFRNADVYVNVNEHQFWSASHVPPTASNYSQAQFGMFSAYILSYAQTMLTFSASARDLCRALPPRDRTVRASGPSPTG